ncbi:hypothetical protein [Microbacterium aurum]
MREQFTTPVAKGSRQFLNESTNDRLKTALGAGVSVPAGDTAQVTSEAVAVDNLEQDTEIETTLEELEGYQIVKAIACGVTKPQRITQRDAKSYFAVLLDDNNRKPIARLHFNGRQKYLGLLDAEKIETRHPIESLDEIYLFADDIREAATRYV